MRCGLKVLMPMTGGAPRPFLNPRENAPAWSPDGNQLAYMTIPTELESGDPLSVADGSGSKPSRRSSFPSRRSTSTIQPGLPTASGSTSCVATDPTGSMDVWRIRPSGGASEQLTHQRAAVNFLAPLDARTAVVRSARGGLVGALAMVRWTCRRRPHAGYLSASPQYISVSASRDGRRVVATVANPTASLWKVPLLDRVAVEADVQPYPLPVPPNRALGPRFRERRSSTCRAAEPARGCGGSRMGRRPKSGETWMAH